MKSKVLIIATIIFFLIVNTTYYWESNLGLFAMPATLLLIAFYLGLFTALLRQLFLAIKEKFKDRERFVSISLLTIVLVLTYFKPFGLIDFEKLQGNDILVAQQEGAANCMTSFKLKENNKFREKSICFGTLETKGNYKIHNDTIFFENVKLGRYENGFYKFAVIRPSKFATDNNHFDLVRYKDYNDTTGHELKIIKIDLYKLKKESRTANKELSYMALSEYVLNFISLFSDISS